MMNKIHKMLYENTLNDIFCSWVDFLKFVNFSIHWVKWYKK